MPIMQNRRYHLWQAIKDTVFYCLIISLVLPVSAVKAQDEYTQATVCPLAIGKPYRSPEASTVFYITPECQKRPIFNPDVYFSHFSSWNEVIFLEAWEIDEVPDHPLNFLPWGPKRTFGNNSLIKTTDDPRVYIVVNQTAYPFEDEATFKAYGFAFNQIEDVTPEVFAQFQIQEETLKSVDDAPASLAFKYELTPQVFILKRANGEVSKYYVSSMEELNQLTRSDRLAIFPTPEIGDSMNDIPDAIVQDTTSDSSDSGGGGGGGGGAASTVPSVPADTTAPTASFTAPGQNAEISGTTVISVSATDNIGISSVTFQIGNTTLASDTNAPYSTALDSTNYTNGTYTLHAAIIDTSGNTTAISRNITINNVEEAPAQDNTAPTVAFSTPSNGATISGGSQTLQASASDNNAVAQVRFMIGETLLATDTTSPYSTTLNTTVYQNGSYTLYAVARDTSGNNATSSIGVTINNVALDVTPPVISSVASSTSATTATLTWTTNEATTSTIAYGATTSYGSTQNNNTPATSHSMTLTGLTASSLYHFRITSSDGSGNTTVSSDYTLRTTEPASGTTYEVTTDAEMLAVPWLSLEAGDEVRIHWKAEPYRVKIGLRAQGTAEAPVKITGVVGPGNALPEISGENAATPAVLSSFYTPYSEQWPTESLGVILIDRGPNTPYSYKPKYITIQNLKISGGYTEHTYTALDGTSQYYDNFSSGIHALIVENLIIHNCEITDNGEALFVVSRGDEDQTSRNLLVEYSKIYGNGVAGSDRRHNIYTEVVGATFQYNYIGRERDTATGSTLKDRSAGLIVRYNYIEATARALDIVDVEDGGTILQNTPGYHETYVYGNVILNDMDTSNHSGNIVHYGYDNVPAGARLGPHYFYNNTVVVTGTGEADIWRTNVFDGGKDWGTAEWDNQITVNLYNNIFYYTPGLTASGQEMNIANHFGTYNFEGTNWLSTGWSLIRPGHEAIANQNGTIINGTSPGFANEAGRDFTLTGGSPAIDQATALPSALTTDYPLVNMYTDTADGVYRATVGSGVDLGAFESDGTGSGSPQADPS